MPTDPTALLVRESRSLVQRLRLWTPARFAAHAGLGAGLRTAGGPATTRGDVVHHLAQCLADDAARLEGGPVRALPRLDTDLALPDQLAVTADDLVRGAPPPEVARAATAHLLAHRRDLLGEDVPAALADELGTDPAGVLALGRRACEEPRARP